MLPLPSNREGFLFGNIVAKPLRARPPSFEERLQCGTWQPTTIMEDMWADQTHKEPRHLLGRSKWSLSTQHGLPCDLFHEIGRCQRTCVLCSNAPPWQEQMTEKKKTIVERYALQTNTNTDGRVESCDTGQPTSDHEKQMLHNFT